MRVVILAAGQSRRFKDEGIMVPKPLLQIEWRGTILSMLEHVMRTVPVEYQNKIVIAISPEFVAKMAIIPISTNKLFIVESTKGPAETVLKTMQHLEPEATLIMDVDVLNFTNDLHRLTNLSRCGVLVSWSANPAFSYVDNVGVFKRIREKQRISEYAVRGAYFVPLESRFNFIRALEEVSGAISEPYISQALDHMDEEKYAMQTSYTPLEWGTPRDVRISGAHIVMNKEQHNVRNRSNQRP
jgi:dTDP-glucose pyrophosphorylase